MLTHCYRREIHEIEQRKRERRKRQEKRKKVEEQQHREKMLEMMDKNPQAASRAYEPRPHTVHRTCLPSLARHGLRAGSPGFSRETMGEKNPLHMIHSVLLYTRTHARTYTYARARAKGLAPR